MKGINTINMQRLNNGAHYTFASNILARAEADSAVTARAAELVGKLRAAVAAEDKALNVSRKSFHTDDITRANNDRIAFYRGYRRAVKAFLCIPDADTAEAAKALMQHIKDYNIDPRGQLDKKTGLLVNFLEDLEGRLAAKVAKLGLTIFVTKMKEANEQVRTSTLLRTRERMGIVVGAMKKARAATDNAYRTLVKMVNALAFVFGETEYTSFIDYVNTEVTHYKREAIGKKGKAVGTAEVGTAAETENESVAEVNAAADLEKDGTAEDGTAAGLVGAFESNATPASSRFYSLEGRI